MSRNAGPTVEDVLRRTDSYGGISANFDWALKLLSRSQRIANAGLKRVKTSDTLTTRPYLAIYNIRDEFSDIIDIVSIKDGDRMLLKADSFADLAAYDNNWLRATGTQFNIWLQIGRELLILCPILTSADSLTVDYTKLTTEYSTRDLHYNTAMDLSDEDTEIAAGVMELVMLARSRLHETAKRRAQKLIEQFNQVQRVDIDER